MFLNTLISFGMIALFFQFTSIRSSMFLIFLVHVKVESNNVLIISSLFIIIILLRRSFELIDIFVDGLKTYYVLILVKLNIYPKMS